MTDPTGPDPATTQDELVADIEQTREQLRETVDSLASKLDVKGNTRARIEQTKQDLAARVSHVTQGARDAYGRTLASEPVRRARSRPAVPLAVAVAATVLGLAVWRARSTGSTRVTRAEWSA